MTTLIGLELNDAGIMAAAGPRSDLLPLDGQALESPGFAFVDGRILKVGREAVAVSRLHPNRTASRFWDLLDAPPRKADSGVLPSHAELAFAHLKMIRQRLKRHGANLIIAVPAFYTREQLGLLLGMAAELGVTVKGLIAAPLAAVDLTDYKGMLIVCDITLHRLSTVYLEQGREITVADALDGEASGQAFLYSQYIKAIADNFVRATRFDPLHHAADEQALYDRLPDILTALKTEEAIDFSISGATRTHSVRLSREHFITKSRPMFKHLHKMASRLQAQNGLPGIPLVLCLTHRLANLPGCLEFLGNLENAEIVTLAPGAAAVGALKAGMSTDTRADGRGVALLASRSLPSPAGAGPDTGEHSPPDRPTHILYRHVAHPIGAQPLIIGSKIPANGPHIHIQGQPKDVSPHHCTIETRGDRVVLENHSTHGTFVDGRKVSGSTDLKLGQPIELGRLGVIVQPIVVLDADET